MSFFHANINSLLAHGDAGDRMSHLHNRIQLRKHDVISLSETKLSSAIEDSEVNLEGFQIFRKDRNRHGGGVACFVKNNIPAKLISELHNNNFEFLWV